MSSSYKNAVVLIPPSDLWAPIQNIRKQYDSKLRRWMPHITLFYPFYTEEDFYPLMSQFEEVAKGLNSFEINLENFNFFKHRRHFTLWLEPTPKTELVNLYRTLSNLLPQKKGSRKKSRFTPHLTVGQFEERETMERTIKNLENNWKSLHFSISEFYFISREDPPNDIFQVLKKFELKVSSKAT